MSSKYRTFSFMREKEICNCRMMLDVLLISIVDVCLGRLVLPVVELQ